MTKPAETTAAPSLTDFQKWDGTPAAEVETAAPSAPEPETEPAAKTEPASDPEETDIQDGDADENDGEAEPQTKSKKTLRKRFSELTGQIRDLKQQQATLLAAAKVTPGPATPPAAEASAKAPVLADFDDYDKYNKALVSYEVRQLLEAQAREVTAREAAKQQKAKAEAWNEKAKVFRAQTEDYDEVLLAADKTPVSQVMHEFIGESKFGPALVYQLAQDPKAAARIAALAPLAAVRELIQLEAQFDAPAPEKPKPAVSKAPKPPQPVSGANAADQGKQPDPKDFKAWSKWRDRQEALGA